MCYGIYKGNENCDVTVRERMPQIARKDTQLRRKERFASQFQFEE